MRGISCNVQNNCSRSSEKNTYYTTINFRIFLKQGISKKNEGKIPQYKLDCKTKKKKKLILGTAKGRKTNTIQE